MSGETLFHVEFASGTHKYFGSIAAIYDIFDAETLRVAAQTLYNFEITPDRPYKNKVITIRKDFIHRKKGKRKLPTSY